MNQDEKTMIKEYMKYQNLFWLFMIANMFGVLLEGIWTLVKFGRWESHVVTIWGPFCLLYGVGAVVFYLASVAVRFQPKRFQFVIFALMADVVEYLCAWMLDAGLGMKAWTYNKHFMNLHGRISLQMTIIWGAIGMVFFYVLIPRIICLFQKMQNRIWHYACIALTAFMIVNLAATTLCLIRWSQRHRGAAPSNQLEVYIDQTYDDAWMKQRFCEWWFKDEAKEFWQAYKK